MLLPPPSLRGVGSSDDARVRVPVEPAAAESHATPAPCRSGAKFASLSAEQQQFASDRVRGMRPHFEAELNDLVEQRGRGAHISGEDIKVLLPRVMARAARAAA